MEVLILAVLELVVSSLQSVIWTCSRLQHHLIRVMQQRRFDRRTADPVLTRGISSDSESWHREQHGHCVCKQSGHGRRHLCYLFGPIQSDAR